jgi:molecular chaperone HtpG
VSGPYRDSESSAPAEAPRDQGIVGEVIAQFADPNAFYRELVQNSIDAGTPSVEVEISYDASARRVHAVVRDRGEGMTREIVENQLLVLFRSSKEKDKTKIGKFGIGFSSVLAPNPEVVVVHTARDRRRLTLHLYRDLSYELFDAGPATQNGTSVGLEIAMNAEDVEAFVDASETALVRWCRHASVPIDFIDNTGAEPIARRIDRPLELEGALVSVRGTTDGGQLVAVVGLGATPYAGFFNHGLMLYETGEPLIGKLAVKIQDSRLGHTISRDDVRRDASFDRAVAYAKELARTELARAAAERLRQHAEAGSHAEHDQLVLALQVARIELPAWHYPLVELLGEQRTVDVKAIGRRGWAATKTSPVTALLAKRGEPVVHVDVTRFAEEIAGLTGCRLRDVSHELTSISPVERMEADELLLATLEELLDRAHRKPRGLALGRLEGVRAELLAIAGGDEDAEHVVDRDEAARNPFALLQRRRLVLSANHRLVRAARQATDPRLAASHLARAVLLQYRLLDRDASRKILEYTLGAVR